MNPALVSSKRASNPPMSRAVMRMATICMRSSRSLSTARAAGTSAAGRGAAVDEPGLYFVGLHFLYAMSSDTVNGVGRDAEWIARAIAARIRDAMPRSQSGRRRRVKGRSARRGVTAATPAAGPARR